MRIINLLRDNRVLVFILLVASVLRLIGLYPGYNKFHSDEPIISTAALDMVRNKNLDPIRFDYPGPAIYLNYAFYQLFFIPLSWGIYYFSHIFDILDGLVKLPIPQETRAIIFEDYILGHREANLLYWSRFVTAMFGIGNVLMTYLLARKLFGKRVGLLAALFVTFDYKQVINSHLTLPDIYNSFFLLFSLLTTVNLWTKPNTKNYVIAAIFAGLAVSVKYQFFALLPLLLVHLYLIFPKLKHNLLTFFSRDLFIIFIVVALVFLLTSPYSIVKFEEFSYWLRIIAEKYGMGAKSLNLYPIAYLYHIDIGPLLFLLAILGCLYLLFTKTKKALLLLAVLTSFSYVIFYYSHGGFYVRNLITISPLLLIFSAFVFEKITSFLKHRAVVILALGLVLYIPARNSTIGVYYFTKPWNYQTLSDWLFLFPPKETVAANSFDPPTGSPPLEKTEFHQDTNYSLQEHIENGARYALVNMDWASPNFYGWMFYGFDGLQRFWNKPVWILKNMFPGLAISEIVRYRVFATTKPWQSPDAALVLAKFPEWPDTPMKLINKYSFDEDIKLTIYGNIDNLAVDYRIDKNNGFSRPGSLFFPPSGAKFQIVRLALPHLPVKANYLYKIVGKLRLESDISPRLRDGFLRVDFYNQGADLEKVGIISAVSARVYADGVWAEKMIIERAPVDSDFAVVSLQVNSSIGSKLWLDDLYIYESEEEIGTIESHPPYVNTEVDLDNLLYQNSHGNL